MSETLTSFLAIFKDWPIAQYVAGALLFYVGIRAIQRGEKDRKESDSGPATGAPNWTMYGPVHDAIGAVHDLNEQSRAQLALLERIDTGLQQCKTALEMIRNESRLR